MTSPPREDTKHKPELDGIRGLAILGVLCSHGVGVTGIFLVRHSIADKILAYLMVPLWGGVDLFFVLSGFLITGILLRTKKSEHYFSSFYARRALRIFPIYYLTLILCVTVAHFSLGIASALPQWTSWKFAYFIYLQNWPVFWHGEKIMGGLWGAYWSLAIEEQFYFVWPLVVFLLPEKAVTRICYVGVICALPLRILISYCYFGDSFGLAQITSSRVDGLFLGAACALYMFSNKKPVPMAWIRGAAIAGAGIMGYIVLFHRGELIGTAKWMTTLGITGFALLSAAIVAASQHHFPALDRILTMSWLRVLGKYSYGIYVYHLLIFLPSSWYLRSEAGSWIHLSFPERILLMLAEMIMVVAIAVVSYDLFEVRFLQLKRRFTPA